MFSFPRSGIAGLALSGVACASTYIVGNYHASTLLSLPNQSVVASGITAVDIAVDANGNFVTAAEGGLQRATPAGAVTTINAPSGQWESVAIDAQGNYLAADNSNHVVWRVNAASSAASQVAAYPVCNSTLDDVKVRVRADGNYLVLSDNCGYVRAFLMTPAGSVTEIVLSVKIPLALGGLTFDPGGNYMVVSGSLLYSITPSGTVTTLGSGNPLAPGTLVGLAYDPAAAVYLTCDWRNNTLYSVTPAGVATALLAGAPLSMPEAVVVIPSPASLPAPTITSAISASGFGAFSSVAPGSWIEIYGNNFSLNAPRLWTGADFVGNTAPTQLSGVQVKIGGQNAFVEYVSDQQINAQVPAIGTGASQITVTTAWGASAPYNIVVNPTEAGLLAPPSFQIGGKQYVVAQHLDGTYVLPPGAISGVSSSQAKPGETIVIYGVGFGQVTPGIGEGQIEPGQSQLASQFQMVFGTTQAQVTYDGLAPGLVGLYQFNVVVPQIANSDLVPLGFTLAGGSGAQTLYSAVHQ